MSRATRWVLGLGILLGLAGIATLAMGWLALSRVESVLTSRGCQIGNLVRKGPDIEASDIRCEGLAISRMVLTPASPHLRIEGIDMDLQEGLPRDLGGPSQAPTRMDFTRTILTGARIDGLRVRWGHRVLAADLEGTLVPLDLQGPTTRIQPSDDGFRVEARQPLDIPEMKGALEIRMQVDGDARQANGRICASDLRLSHPLLSRRSLVLGHPCLDFQVSTDRGYPSMRGEISIDALRLDLEASLSPEEGPIIDLELPPSPAQDVLGVMLPIVPELEHATIGGRLGLSLHRQGVGRPVVTVHMEDLEADGALPPGVDLAYGVFTYRIRKADGEYATRVSGEGTPDWIPLRSVSPHLVHAVQAAEDSAFRTHNGYDPKAIQEALTENLLAGQVSRGGSTLTQQLAKNLFLDSEQTLERKVRELLLAVELEQTLGKDRILELYLNVVEFGPDLWGLGPACDLYFLKSPARLNPWESAWLAILLPSPREYHRNWFLAHRIPELRMIGVLENMTDAGWLTASEADRWRGATLDLAPPPKSKAVTKARIPQH